MPRRQTYNLHHFNLYFNYSLDLHKTYTKHLKRPKYPDGYITKSHSLKQYYILKRENI